MNSVVRQMNVLVDSWFVTGNQTAGKEKMNILAVSLLVSHLEFLIYMYVNLVSPFAMIKCSTLCSHRSSASCSV